MKLTRRAFAAGAAALASAGGSARAQTTPATEADHRRLLDLLGIERLRPGADGWNLTAPNAANYDEAKAGLAALLPDPLRFQDGRAVGAAGWPRRRAEIQALFDREVYGATPTRTPALGWRTIETREETIGATPAMVRVVRGVLDNAGAPAIRVEIEAEIVTPRQGGSAPMVLALSWPRAVTARFPPEPGQPWTEQLLERGWGHVRYSPTSVQADDGAGLAAGVIGLSLGGRPRGLDDWGALKAWGWGASRVLDHLETLPEVDARRVAVFGLSRYGKAALVAMAEDPRFAAGLIASSGAGGAKLLRRDFGERVENLASSGEYHWFGPRFLRYAGPLTVADLPVDAHQLIALCAPRPVFISVGSFKEDGWTDPRGMFMAAVAAGPVYRLLGARPLASADYPATGTLVDGDLAFRQHAGGHTAGPNWPTITRWLEARVRPAVTSP